MPMDKTFLAYFNLQIIARNNQTLSNPNIKSSISIGKIASTDL